MTGASTGLGSRTYTLNALGQRYAKTLSGTTTVYLYDQAGHLIAETSDGGTTYTEYLWLHDTPVAVIKPGSAALYYIHSDHLDTPRLIANQTPQTVWRWDNDDPFGANMANSNPGGLGTFVFNLRLPGQYFDAETNYHYNYYRDYSPEIGRYIESDPIGLQGGLNTFSYVRNDPVNSTDSLGLACPDGDVMCKIGERQAGIPQPQNPPGELDPECFVKCVVLGKAAVAATSTVLVNQAASRASGKILGPVAGAAKAISNNPVVVGTSAVLGLDYCWYNCRKYPNCPDPAPSLPDDWPYYLGM